MYWGAPFCDQPLRALYEQPSSFAHRIADHLRVLCIIATHAAKSAAVICPIVSNLIVPRN